MFEKIKNPSCRFYIQHINLAELAIYWLTINPKPTPKYLLIHFVTQNIA